MSEVEILSWIRKNVRAADPLLWVVEKKLACAPRPLRYHPAFGGRNPLIPSEAASALVEAIDPIRVLRSNRSYVNSLQRWDGSHRSARGIHRKSVPLEVRHPVR